VDASNLVAALLAFIGAAVGSMSAVRYARQKAFEESIGAHSARRRLEVVERLACLLAEALEISDVLEGADPRGKLRESIVVLDELAHALPLARIYLPAQLHGLLSSIHHWIYLQADPESNYVKPDNEPDYEKAWTLLAAAAHCEMRPER
jgi:hypothetical protein